MSEQLAVHQGLSYLSSQNHQFFQYLLQDAFPNHPSSHPKPKVSGTLASLEQGWDVVLGQGGSENTAKQAQLARPCGHGQSKQPMAGLTNHLTQLHGARPRPELQLPHWKPINIHALSITRHHIICFRMRFSTNGNCLPVAVCSTPTWAIPLLQFHTSHAWFEWALDEDLHNAIDAWAQQESQLGFQSHYQLLMSAWDWQSRL